jgi:hypothetical protein
VRVVALNRAPHEHDLTLEAKRLDLSLLPAGVLADLYAYWLAKGNGGRLPGRADIDPLDLSWALGRLCLLEVSRDPLVFRYRLDGSMVASHRGRDMTGRATDEVRPLALANILREQYSQIATTGAPGYFEVRCARNTISATYTTLALPLAADGAQVDMILACALGTEAMYAFS